MWRRIGLLGLAIVLTAASILLFSLSSTPIAAHAGAQLVSSTPTSSSTNIPTSDTSSQVQDLLNIINVYTAILGVILALFALLVGGLTFLGFRSYKEVNDLAKELHVTLEKSQKEAAQTRQALVYISLGDRLLNQNYVAEALENYKKAGALLPNDPQINYLLGRIYSNAGDFEAAIAAFKAALQAQTPDQARILKELGLAYRRRGEALKQDADYDEAIQLLKKASLLNPGDADTLAVIGGLYRRRKEYLLAIDYYEQAWRANPGLSYALGNLASLSWFLGKVSDARMYFGYAEVAAMGHIKKGQSEGFWDYYDLALARMALGKLAESKEAYTKAIQETPGNVQFDSVLNNLYLLQQAPQIMPGLDEVIKMLEDARV